MLLQIAQHVQQYLHAHNQPPAKSFYEEMMLNKRKQEEQKEEEQRQELERLKKKEEKEVWAGRCTIRLYRHTNLIILEYMYAVMKIVAFLETVFT